jgi:transposase
MNYDTTKLMLGIDDKHIKIKAGIKRNDGIIQLTGQLTYRPKACPHCGVVNDHKIINYGWRKTNVRFAQTLGNNVLLKLNRRNFKCKECQRTFLAQTSLVPKHCSISNPTRQECLERLEEPVSLKHIANELATSDSFIARMLMQAETYFEPNWQHLPEVLLMDEIKSTNNADETMSFELMDAETHELIDLLPFRSIHKLQHHFRHYTETARQKVKIIVTDMNYTYPKLVGTVFPDAIVLIDRFHIINALNRAFTKTRIRIMKSLPTYSRQYRALKRYWKLLLQPAEDVDYTNYHKWTNFSHLLCAKDVVDQLLSIDPELKATYQVLNSLRYAIKINDWNNYNAAFWHTDGISLEMQQALETLREHHDEIKNTFNYPYTNGPLEGTNNKIKAIKRAGFGYKSFRKFRARVLYTLRIKTKKVLITK